MIIIKLHVQLYNSLGSADDGSVFSKPVGVYLLAEQHCPARESTSPCQLGPSKWMN